MIAPNLVVSWFPWIPSIPMPGLKVPHYGNATAIFRYTVHRTCSVKNCIAWRAALTKEEDIINPPLENKHTPPTPISYPTSVLVSTQMTAEKAHLAMSMTNDADDPFVYVESSQRMTLGGRKSPKTRLSA